MSFLSRSFATAATRTFVAATVTFVAALAHAQAPAPDSPAIEHRVDSLLGKLSLEQKIDLLHGEDWMYTHAIPEIGLPRLKTSDGPYGVNHWNASTAYAIGIGLAASWDTALAYEVGTSLGRDARARGVHMLLGPGVNIYRAPMNGRNGEYFGEDPFLAGRTAVGYIRGLQDEGVVATIKHFIGNESEYDRHRMSSDMDERTMREIYLLPFEMAVKDAHVGSIMDAYNHVNGVFMTENAFLNDTVARKDWGFDGLMMSDWHATWDGVKAVNGGLDLEMPDGAHLVRDTLLPAVKDGRISVATIDEHVRRLLRLAVRFGFLDRPQDIDTIPTMDHTSRAVALQTSLEGTVMLKNEHDLLPLDAHHIHTIAVIGPDAWPARTTSGGSAHVNDIAPVSILEGIDEYLTTHHTAGTPMPRVMYDSGVRTPRPEEETHRDTSTINAVALRMAKEADVVILAVGFDARSEQEDKDRTFALPRGQEELIKAVTAVNPHTVVLVTSGGNVAMTDWIDQVPALLFKWYPGGEGGHALAQILFGASPEGHLPITLEKQWADNPTYHSYYPTSGIGTDVPHVNYSEGVFVGYRGYSADKPPLFPFGFGLSYTTFSFSHLSVTPSSPSLDKPVTVAFDVTNTGHRAGAEVAQVYVGDPSAQTKRPARELKGFAKVRLRPGETRHVVLTLDRRAFAYWDTPGHAWRVDPGQFVIYVGSSVADTPLQTTITAGTP